MSEALDLRSALEQDRQQVLDLLETTRRLVLEVRAAHYWTVEALNSFSTLLGIGQNIQRMLAQVSPYWDEGRNVFKRPEAVKLYKTSIGLWAALRPVRQKFGEQLDKRRRQRIMGEEYVEVADVTPEEIEKHMEEFSQRHAEMWTLFVELAEPVAAVPSGLVPQIEVPRMPGAVASPAAPATATPAAAAPATAAANAPATAAPAAAPSPVAAPAAAPLPSPSVIPGPASVVKEAAEPQASAAGPGGKLTLLPEPGSLAPAPQGSLTAERPMAIVGGTGIQSGPAPEEEYPDDERLQPRAQAEQFIASLSGPAEVAGLEGGPLEAPATEEYPAAAPVAWPDAALRIESAPLSIAPAAAEPQAIAPEPAPQALAPEPAPQAQSAPAAQGGSQSYVDPKASLDRLFGAEARQHDAGLDSNGRPRITWGGDQ